MKKWKLLPSTEQTNRNRTAFFWNRQDEGIAGGNGQDYQAVW